ncbi:MAG: DUF4349 domain-containing protein [Actinobacteria bacterium]|nr:DUF4349 domain-containing protein [Actinomycetota bacterium]
MKNRLLKSVLGIISVFIILVFVFTGCSAARSASIPDERAATVAQEEYAQDNYKADYGEAEVMPEEAPATTAAGQDASQELYTEAGSSDVNTPTLIDTKLIKNGYIDIEVQKGEFDRIFFEVSALAQKYNGYVSNSQTYSDSDGNMTSGSVILRIDKQHFDTVVNKIKEMGKVKNVNVYVQDVTQEYVDNESRLKNLASQQKRLLELMDQSVTVKDSIEVQRELSNVEGQIEVIKGRQNYLDNLIAYSTVEVYISEPVPITDADEGGFIGAVKRGARGALTALRVITMVLIAASPLLVIAGIILIIIWQSIRARNRKRAKRAQEKQLQQNN